MSKRLVGAVVALSFCTVGAGGQAVPAPKMDKNTPVVVILPSSATLIQYASKAFNGGSMAVGIRENGGAAYGFGAGVGKDSGSFKLGVLQADLEISLLGDDRARAAVAASALQDGFAHLGAPLPLLTAAMNLGSSIGEGLDMNALARGALPVLRPFVDDFAKKEGLLNYVRFGEWAECTRLILLAAKSGQVKFGEEFLATVTMAGYYEGQLKGLPPGVVQSLKQVDELSRKKGLTADDLAEGANLMQKIVNLMAA